MYYIYCSWEVPEGTSPHRTCQLCPIWEMFGTFPVRPRTSLVRVLCDLGRWDVIGQTWKLLCCLGLFCFFVVFFLSLPCAFWNDRWRRSSTGFSKRALVWLEFCCLCWLTLYIWLLPRCCPKGSLPTHRIPRSTRTSQHCSAFQTGRYAEIRTPLLNSVWFRNLFPFIFFVFAPFLFKRRLEFQHDNRTFIFLS